WLLVEHAVLFGPGMSEAAPGLLGQLVSRPGPQRQEAEHGIGSGGKRTSHEQVLYSGAGVFHTGSRLRCRSIGRRCRLNRPRGGATAERPPLPLRGQARAARAAEGAARQFSALLRAGPDPGRTAVGRWTVRDVAAHVTGGAELYTQLVRGTPSPARSIE